MYKESVQSYPKNDLLNYSVSEFYINIFTFYKYYILFKLSPARLNLA